MDIAGARALRLRIEQQQHWCQAAAVRVGRQPAGDPDACWLREFGDGLRSYVVDGGWFRKRLVDGAWLTEAVHT
jgi:hypothetical protein